MQEQEIAKENEILTKFGLGIEHFVKRGDEKLGFSREENINMILDTAYNLGIRHFDLVYNYPHFFKVFKTFLQGKREQITFSTHIGQVYDENKEISKKTRSLKQIKASIDYILECLDINFIDVGIIQFVSNMKDFELIKARSILKFANDLKKEGKIKSIGISAHNPDLLLQIISKNEFDVIMFPYNFVNGHLDSSKQLIRECKKNNIEIMAIKTLLHGKPFSTKKIKYPKHMTCGNNVEVQLHTPARPYQAFNYVLDAGIDKIIFGVTNTDQLVNNITEYRENKGTQDYIEIVDQFMEKKII